jgi:hypothetical protein
MRLVLRLATAGFVAWNGSVHLRLWRDGYKAIDDVGVLFLVNVVVAAVLAVSVLARPAPAVLVAVVAFSTGTLGALVLSRTDGGFLGFMEAGWSEDAKQALVAAVGAVVTAGALLALEVSRRRSRRPAPG